MKAHVAKLSVTKFNPETGRMETLIFSGVNHRSGHPTWHGFEHVVDEDGNHKLQECSLSRHDKALVKAAHAA